MRVAAKSVNPDFEILLEIAIQLLHGVGGIEDEVEVGFYLQRTTIARMFVQQLRVSSCHMKRDLR